MNQPIQKERKTKETHINVSLTFNTPTSPDSLTLDTPLPFLNHMLHAMLFHGAWSGTITASGDVDIDYHHLVEDMGIVLGSVFAQQAFNSQPIQRFGHAVIPMDDALGESTVDFCNRAYMCFNVHFPQQYILLFDTDLCREFFTAFAHNAHCNLHIRSHYGLNSHHIAESIFKASGKAIYNALLPNTVHHSTPSTKGSI